MNTLDSIALHQLQEQYGKSHSYLFVSNSPDYQVPSDPDPDPEPDPCISLLHPGLRDVPNHSQGWFSLFPTPSQDDIWAPWPPRENPPDVPQVGSPCGCCSPGGLRPATDVSPTVVSTTSVSPVTSDIDQLLGLPSPPLEIAQAPEMTRGECQGSYSPSVATTHRHCTYCGSQVVKSKFKRHQKHDCADSPLKLPEFRCYTCQKLFPRQDNLKRHQKKSCKGGRVLPNSSSLF